MQTKLTSWKGSQLAFAGRVTLVKSVIKALPIYQMMTTNIPKTCIQEIHKIQRKFIWGEGIDERRYHAVRWSVITKPKDVGGLGLRKLDVMNQVCILKIGWNLHAGNEDLNSVVVLRGKYNRHGTKDTISKKPTYSSLWKSIINLWPMINEDFFGR